MERFFIEVSYFLRSTRNGKMRLLSRTFRMDAALLASRDAALYQWKLNLNDLNDVSDIRNGKKYFKIDTVPSQGKACIFLMRNLIVLS